MTNHTFQICRDSASTALSLLFWLTLLACTAAAQQPRSKALDSILGVKIGISLEEARAKLNPLGSRDGRATREGGRKEAWTLKETDFASVALKTDAAGRIVWVTGFLRPGRELPFTELGDLWQAQNLTEAQAIWNVIHSNSGYRLVVKGPNRRAKVVYLLSLASKPME
jgi:hypothetical protein